jgi:hypothetical protein
MKRFMCKLLGHKWKYKGIITAIGPGEYLGNGLACYGVPTECFKYECCRCGKEITRRTVL